MGEVELSVIMKNILKKTSRKNLRSIWLDIAAIKARSIYRKELSMPGSSTKNEIIAASIALNNAQIRFTERQ